MTTIDQWRSKGGVGERGRHKKKVRTISEHNTTVSETSGHVTLSISLFMWQDLPQNVHDYDNYTRIDHRILVVPFLVSLVTFSELSLQGSRMLPKGTQAWNLGLLRFYCSRCPIHGRYWPGGSLDGLKTREETKGWFRKRVVLANVPSFRFFVPGEHANVPSFRFSFRGTSECTLVPGFVPGEHPPKPTFCGPILLRTLITVES